jgi:hypothetical protein
MIESMMNRDVLDREAGKIIILDWFFRGWIGERGQY